MLELINDFNIDTFHFIRPKILWIGPAFLLIFLLSLIRHKQKVKWQKRIAPHLRKYVIINQKSGYGLMQWLFLLFSISLLILSAAGPTWKMKDVPGMKTETVLLIGVDCSLSMLADDVQPNRLERAKLKVNDLLEANPRARVGLFAFSGTAHPVVPVCSDYKLIKHHINSLSPGIMPIQGTNLKIAMNLADSMLSRSDAPGTLLLITDNIDFEGKNAIRNFLNTTDHNVELLPVATTKGAKVPSYGRGRYFKDANGEFVISKLELGFIRDLLSDRKFRLHDLTLDNSDVSFIAQEISENLEIQLDNTISDEEWEDVGLWLLWPAAFLVLLWFRRGWVMQFVLIFMFGWQSCSPDSRNANWWYSSDYIAQYYENADSFALAADKYLSLQHKAVAYYKAENYEAALSLFVLDSSASGNYNQALVLAKLGRYNESIIAMNMAIKLDPSLPESQALLNEFEKNKHVQDSINNQFGNKKQLSEKQENNQDLNTRKASGKDEELTSDTEVEELPEHGNRVADEVETDMRKAEEMERPDGEIEMPDMKVDPQNIMLRKISDDPGEFLRRRFRMQKERYYADVKEVDNKW